MTTSPADPGENEKGIEVRARTIDEAIARGLVRLGGLSRAEVKIDVVSDGRGGLLGFGAKEAVVRITPLAPGERAEDAGVADVGPGPEAVAAPPEAPPPSAPPRAAPRARSAAGQGAAPPPARQAAAPARPVVAARAGAGSGAEGATARPVDPAEAADAARAVLGDILKGLGYEQATMEVQESLLPADIEEEDGLVVCVRGAGLDGLLGNQGRPLQALQFIARLLVNRRLGGWVNLLVDINGDRSRRIKEIYQMAEQSAALVIREGRPVSLPPMSPYERRVVHLALRDHATIATQSIGAGPNRKVTVRRKDQLLPILDTEG